MSVAKYVESYTAFPPARLTNGFVYTLTRNFKNYLSTLLYIHIPAYNSVNKLNYILAKVHGNVHICIPYVNTVENSIRRMHYNCITVTYEKSGKYNLLNPMIYNMN